MLALLNAFVILCGLSLAVTTAVDGNLAATFAAILAVGIGSLGLTFIITSGRL